MSPQTEVHQVRTALNKISAAALAEFGKMWGPIAAADFGPQRATLDHGWPTLIETFGDMSAALMADLNGVDPVRGVDPARANARMRWALGTPEPLANLERLTDELVKQPARSTVARAAASSGASWSRAPTTRECEFCRQFVGHRFTGPDVPALKFHGNCDCVAVLNT